MCDDDAVQNVNSIFDEPDGEITIENINDVYSKFCQEVHRNMALTLPVKLVSVRNGKNTIEKGNPDGQMSYQSYGRSGARQKNCTVRVTMILRGNYASSFCLINKTLMMRFDVQKHVQKDTIGLRNRKKYCQSTSPMLSER